jgi:hypothetical protein
MIVEYGRFGLDVAEYERGVSLNIDKGIFCLLRCPRRYVSYLKMSVKASMRNIEEI